MLPSLNSYCKVALLSLVLVASGSLYANKKRSSVKRSKRTVSANKVGQKRKLSVESEISKDRRSIDFDKAIDIDGQRRNPLGALLSDQKQADKNYEFIKMRLRWRKEMIESAYDLTL